jgi:hypothetical protein
MQGYRSSLLRASILPWQVASVSDSIESEFEDKADRRPRHREVAL